MHNISAKTHLIQMHRSLCLRLALFRVAYHATKMNNKIVSESCARRSFEYKQHQHLKQKHN